MKSSGSPHKIGVTKSRMNVIPGPTVVTNSSNPNGPEQTVTYTTHSKLFQPSERLRETGLGMAGAGSAMAVTWALGGKEGGSAAIPYFPPKCFCWNVEKEK